MYFLASPTNCKEYVKSSGIIYLHFTPLYPEAISPYLCMQAHDKAREWNKLEQDKVDQQWWQVCTGAQVVVRRCNSRTTARRGTCRTSSQSITSAKVIQRWHHQFDQLFLEGIAALLLLYKRICRWKVTRIICWASLWLTTRKNW